MLVDLEFRKDQYPWRNEVKLVKFDDSDGGLSVTIDYQITDDKREVYDYPVAHRHQLGIYECNLNFEHTIRDYTIYTSDILDPLNSYGVADNFEQILNHYPNILTSTEPFIVSVTLMSKKDQPKDGGWRWHKWGEYIGTQEPLMEYLYDEPVIEEVFVYEIHHLVPKTPHKES